MKTWDDWAGELAFCVKGVPDDKLRRAAEVLAGARLVVTAGNGGSSCLASHAAQALMKPDWRAGKWTPAICLTDAVPTLTAHANDGGWEDALREAGAPFIDRGATLLLFSSSGNSENILRLAHRARVSKCDIVGFTGFDGGKLRELATVSIHAPSLDYEVVEPAHDALLHRVQYHLRTLKEET